MKKKCTYNRVLILFSCGYTNPERESTYESKCYDLQRTALHCLRRHRQFSPSCRKAHKQHLTLHPLRLWAICGYRRSCTTCFHLEAACYRNAKYQYDNFYAMIIFISWTMDHYPKIRNPHIIVTMDLGWRINHRCKQ